MAHAAPRASRTRWRRAGHGPGRGRSSAGASLAIEPRRLVVERRYAGPVTPAAGGRHLQRPRRPRPRHCEEAAERPTKQSPAPAAKPARLLRARASPGALAMTGGRASPGRSERRG